MGTVTGNNPASVPGSGQIPSTSSITDVSVAANAGIAWTKISKSGSKLSDVGTTFGTAPNTASFNSSTGFTTLAGTGRYWVDALGKLANAKAKGSHITWNDDEQTWDFTTSAIITEYVETNIQLNHNRDNVVAVSPHLHWFQASATMPNLLLQYRWQIIGQAKTTAWTSSVLATNGITYTTGTIHQITECADITPPANSNVSDIVQIRIVRDTANASGLFSGADGLNATVSILDFDIHMCCDTLGSQLEYSK